MTFNYFASWSSSGGDSIVLSRRVLSGDIICYKVNSFACWLLASFYTQRLTFARPNFLSVDLVRRTCTLYHRHVFLVDHETRGDDLTGGSHGEEGHHDEWQKHDVWIFDIV